jgi:hypothetical protein
MEVLAMAIQVETTQREVVLGKPHGEAPVYNGPYVD